MNEQLQKVLADIITKVTSGADAVVEFSKQQLPEVIQQLLVWHFISNLLQMLIPLVLFITAVTICVKFWAKLPRQESRDNDGNFPWIPDQYRNRDGHLHPKYMIIGYGLPIFSFVLGLITLFSMNLTWLKIAIAPKLYLLEYAASLIKSST